MSHFQYEFGAPDYNGDSGENDEDSVLSKSEVEKKVIEGDPDISLIFPSKTTSLVWNCFRIVVYKDIRLHFVTCLRCNCILAYKSRTGTASLLRHSCYKHFLKNSPHLVKSSTQTGNYSNYVDYQQPTTSTPRQKPMNIQDLLKLTANDDFDPINYEDMRIKSEPEDEDDYPEIDVEKACFDRIPKIERIESGESETGVNSDIDEIGFDADDSEDYRPFTGKYDGEESDLISDVDEINEKDITIPEIRHEELTLSLARNQRSLTQKYIEDHQLQKYDLEARIKCQDKDIMIISQRNRKSHIWKRYEVIYYKKVKQNFVQCMRCKCLLSYKKKTGSASLIRHKCHLRKRLLPDIYTGEDNGVDDDDYEPPKRLRMSNEPLPYSEPMPNCLKNLSSLLPTQTARGQYVTKSRLTELAIQQIYFICRELGSADIFNNQTFRSMMQILLNIGADYGRQNIDNILASGEFIKTMLKNMHADIQKNMQEVIVKSSLALSFDLWRNHDKQFLTVIGYVVNEQYQLKRFNLGTVEFQSGVTENFLQHSLINILSKYTNDAETLLEQCVLVCEHEDDIFSKAFENNKKVYCSCYKITQIMNKILDFECKELITICSDIVALIDFLHEKLDTSEIDVESSVYQFYNYDYNQLSVDPSSKLTLFRMLTISHSELTPIFQQHDNVELLEAVDLDSIRFLLELLDPFQKCIERLSSDTQPTLNEVYLWKKKLEKHCQIVDTDSKFKRIYKQELGNLIKRHFVISDYHQIALFLDPNFKNLKFLTNKERDTVIEVVHKYVDRVIKNDPKKVDGPSSGHKSDAETEASTSVRKDAINDMFFEFMDSSVADGEDDLAKQEIRTYNDWRLPEPKSSLDFWKYEKSNMEHLQRLSRTILNIPACSFSNILKYSESGKILAIKRNLIKLEDIDSTLFLNQNV